VLKKKKRKRTWRQKKETGRGKRCARARVSPANKHGHGKGKKLHARKCEKIPSRIADRWGGRGTGEEAKWVCSCRVNGADT